MWSVAPVAGAYDADRLDPPGRPAPAHRPDGRHVGRTPRRRCSAGWAPPSSSPTTCASSPTASGARAGRAHDSTVDHAPGHTQGSVVFRSPYDGPEDVPEVMFSGDLLFAGSIGRTDLPGGDHAADAASLAAHGAAARRPGRRAARARRADHHRSRAGHQPVPAPRSSTQAGWIELAPGVTGEPPTPLSGFPELLPQPARSPSWRCIDSLRRDVRAARLLLGRDPVGRAARPAAAQGRDLQRGVRAAPAAGRRRRRRHRLAGCTST